MESDLEPAFDQVRYVREVKIRVRRIGTRQRKQSI
jgi:hypothetical protein